ncbi:MAG: hypothetical protein GWO29_04010 [Gammaproteobacteria bacterium]|nr:hypothetical protein [Gammaproteobacteria bacterium]NIS04217.1 hypothetical protein [Gammaproteobacteria bacterium]NIX98845.1 hypothetical protein [Gammaproteobacteria bacterium]
MSPQIRLSIERTARSLRSANGLWMAAILIASGCATGFSPAPVDDVPFKTRAETQAKQGLTVTVAVPTSEEANAIYGVDMASKNIQPIWVQIENGSERPYWFLPSGLDPAYFSAAEASHAFVSTQWKSDRDEIAEHFRKLQFENPVYPGAIASGFVIVNRDEGYKAIDIDLISREEALNFTYIIEDPSFRGDYTLIDFDALYSSGEITNFEDEASLQEALEALPCCTTNREGNEQGDPLNLVLIGDPQDLFPAFIRRGWHGTEILWWKSLLRTVESFLQGTRYRYSPISPLYVFGRQQDLAAQKARGTIHERNHLRLWLTPLQFRGESIWLGQISRDIGVKFTLKSPTISTHVIDPDVDEARDYLVEDLAYSQALATLGWVKGVGAVSEESPRRNLVDDPWFSDGLRAVMIFEPRPRALSDIQILQWDWRPRKITPSENPTPGASQ